MLFDEPTSSLDPEMVGEVLEVSYRQTMMIARGDWTVFFTRPLSLFLFVLVLLSLSVPFIRYLMRRRTGDRQARP